jgi:hypothetical protein
LFLLVGWLGLELLPMLSLTSFKKSPIESNVPPLLEPELELALLLELAVPDALFFFFVPAVAVEAAGAGAAGSLSSTAAS